MQYWMLRGLTAAGNSWWGGAAEGLRVERPGGCGAGSERMF
jgi:hypothetical protein